MVIRFQAAWLALAACAHAPAPSSIDLGELRVAVSTSRTAQLFHIVDQLSGWSPYCHRQYGRWFAQHRPLDDEDRRVLAAHAALASSTAGEWDWSSTTLPSLLARSCALWRMLPR
jgi:hypothetical protein